MRHNYLATEHLLFGLLREGDGLVNDPLAALGVTLGEARAQVVRIVGFGDAPVVGSLPHTPRFSRVCESALREALSLGHNYIGPEHILLGLVRENEGVAATILLAQGADPETVRNQVIRMLTRPKADPVIRERSLEEKVDLLIIKVAALEAQLGLGEAAA